MKLKYYLRGLGVGIIVTTLILIIAFSGRKISDEEVIKRAGELGMVMQEAGTETDNSEIPKAADETEAVNASETTETTEPAEITTETTEQGIAGNIIDDNAEKKPQTEPESEASSDASEKSFTINAGDTSDTVAVNLYKAGLVDDASAFNSYMVKNGYDSRLRTGAYTMKQGLSYEQIMKILLP